ncbi:MAG: hypothetical protein OTJ44_05750 [Planctomycetota bacterium]|nr:hypothetical protein [Planctomycetota bacterium]
MARAIGFHLFAGHVSYALVETLSDSGPQILAAGTSPADAVPSLVQRLSAGRELPWCFAQETQPGKALAPQDLPLSRPRPQARMLPAVAAALWEWENGRIDTADLFLWLLPGQLHYSIGIPGEGQSGTIPRHGPLREALGRALSRTQKKSGNVAIRVDGEAPGGEMLREAAEASGLTPHFLFPPASEQGADAAAAGAALGALDPTRPGTFPPFPPPVTPSWHWSAHVVTVLALGAVALFPRFAASPAVHKDAPIVQSSEKRSLVQPSAKLERAVAHRLGFLKELETWSAKGEALQELELLSSPESDAVLSYAISAEEGAR